MICIQVSQEPGNVIWYSHLFKNFPHLVVKGFNVVNAVEVNVFQECLCLSFDPMDVGNLISGSLPFLNSRTPGSSQYVVVVCGVQ